MGAGVEVTSDGCCDRKLVKYLENLPKGINK